MLPSAVRYGEEGVIEIGDAALAHRGDDALNTITLGQTLHGARAADLRSDATARAISFQRRPAMARPAQDHHAAGRDVAGLKSRRRFCALKDRAEQSLAARCMAP